jgi:hypothetical protein
LGHNNIVDISIGEQNETVSGPQMCGFGVTVAKKTLETE